MYRQYLMIGAQTGATVGCRYNQTGAEGDDRREYLEERETVTEGVPETRFGRSVAEAYTNERT